MLLRTPEHSRSRWSRRDKPACLAAFDLSSFAERHPDGRSDKGEAVGDSLLLGLHVGLDLVDVLAGVDLRDLKAPSFELSLTTSASNWSRTASR